MEKPQKILATKYILFKLSEWYKEVTGQNEENDLSILKTLKLIFLISTINSKDDNNLLDKGFSEYIAMSLGPVESDVYDYMKNELKSLINNRNLNVKDLPNDYKDLPNDIMELINKNFKDLKHKNKNLITESAYNLVELTHKYATWINASKQLKDELSRTIPMDKEQIRNEEKFYFT